MQVHFNYLLHPVFHLFVSLALHYQTDLFVQELSWASLLEQKGQHPYHLSPEQVKKKTTGTVSGPGTIYRLLQSCVCISMVYKIPPCSLGCHWDLLPRHLSPWTK